MKLNLEMIEIYPDLKFKGNEKYVERGTCHVLIKNFNISIKNIRYLLGKGKKKVRVYLPSSIHTVEGEKIRVPHVSFEDPSMKKAFERFCHKELKENC